MDIGPTLRKAGAEEVQRQLDYSPPDGYAHDIEVLRFSELRRLKPDSWFQDVERLSFYIFIIVDRGECMHMAECQFLHLQPGSVLSLKPGQVQRYDISQIWDGWLLLVRPEALDPQALLRVPLDLSTAVVMNELPLQFQLAQPFGQQIYALLAQMKIDGTSTKVLRWGGLLLRLQLQTLCARFAEQCESVAPVHAAVSTGDRARVAAYKAALERDFRYAHHVGHYARLLGVAERSLSRSTQRVLGQTAKEVITARVLLEAKRLLVYTSDPVAQIGYSLGFDEATNFAKFFRRETGQGLQAFRRSVLDR